MGRPLRSRQDGSTEFGIRFKRRKTQTRAQSNACDAEPIEKAAWSIRSCAGDPVGRGKCVTLYGANLVFVLLILGNFLLLIFESAPITGETRVTPYRVHLPTATTAELQLLRGVGPKTATRIVEYRLDHEIDSPDDLTGVHGIGEMTVEGLRQLISEEQIDQ